METVDPLLQGMLSLPLRCDLSTSTSPCWQHEPYSTMFISVTRDDDDVRDMGKHDFRSVLRHPRTHNSNPVKIFSFCSPISDRVGKDPGLSLLNKVIFVNVLSSCQRAHAHGDCHTTGVARVIFWTISRDLVRTKVVGFYELA